MVLDVMDFDVPDYMVRQRLQILSGVIRRHDIVHKQIHNLTWTSSWSLCGSQPHYRARLERGGY